MSALYTVKSQYYIPKFCIFCHFTWSWPNVHKNVSQILRHFRAVPTKIQDWGFIVYAGHLYYKHILHEIWYKPTVAKQLIQQACPSTSKCLVNKMSTLWTYGAQVTILTIKSIRQYVTTVGTSFDGIKNCNITIN